MDKRSTATISSTGGLVLAIFFFVLAIVRRRFLLLVECLPGLCPFLEVKTPLAHVYGQVSLDPLCGIAACWPEHTGVTIGVCFR